MVPRGGSTIDTTRKIHILADLVLLLAALVWGSTFVLVKQSLAYTTPFMFMTLRFALALVIITAVVAPRLKALTRREVTGGLLTGGALFFGFAFQTWGLVSTTASRSAFITGLNVVLVPFLLWGLSHQQLRAKRWVTAGLATLGLLLLTNPLGAAGVNRGDLLTLACAVAFAGHIIFLSNYAPSTDILRYFWVQLIAVTGLAGLATLGTGFLTGTGWTLIPAGPLWWGLGVTGVAATALALLGMTWAQRHLAPTRVALILASEPVFGALFAVAIAGEYLTPAAWLGGGLIVVVIGWSELGATTTPKT
ncbi:MAG: DMT family transporter [Candidatus Marinimicrobia bacterium]|nr:DMT family transporter [Candidatus Neomarinimicrobiota bacterium]